MSVGGGGGGWCGAHSHCEVPEQCPISECGILQAAGSPLVSLRDALHDAGNEGAGASGGVGEEGEQAATQGCQRIEERAGGEGGGGGG